MTTKTCNICKIEQPIERFDRNGKFRRAQCRDCRNTIARNGPKRDRSEYKKQNAEAIQAYHQAHYIANRDSILQRGREYYRKNATAICDRTTAYRKANREWYNEYNRTRRDKLQKNIRRGMWGCLSGRQKTSNTFLYIGCSVVELWQHLISLFQPGMTVDNYGEWHVDHIRPLASFDFTGDDMEDQLHTAWHYSNLQPLWAGDNLSKSDSFLP